MVVYMVLRGLFPAWRLLLDGASIEGMQTSASGDEWDHFCELEEVFIMLIIGEQVNRLVKQEHFHKLEEQWDKVRIECDVRVVPKDGEVRLIVN